MKDEFRPIQGTPSALPILLIILGLVLLLFPGMTLTLIVRLGGIALIAGGLNALGAWPRSRYEAGPSNLDKVGGVLAVLAGLFLVIRPQSLINFFPKAAGILIILGGIYNLLKALASKRAGYDKWTAGMLMALVTVALGVYLVARPFSTMELIVRILGGILIYNGLSSLRIVTR